MSPDEGDVGPAAFPKDLAGLIEVLGIERVFLIGQSMGGFTCLLYALANQRRVLGLVMANSFAGMRREVWLAADEKLRLQARTLWDRRRSDGVKRALAPGFGRRHRDRAFLYKEIRLLNEKGLAKTDVDGRIQRLRALERSPQSSANRERLATLNVPVLFIGGEHDEVMPASLMAVAQTLLPRARLVVVPGAGHSVYFEQPETFNHLVLEFFAECLKEAGWGFGR